MSNYDNSEASEPYAGAIAIAAPSYKAEEQPQNPYKNIDELLDLGSVPKIWKPSPYVKTKSILSDETNLIGQLEEKATQLRSKLDEVMDVMTFLKANPGAMAFVNKIRKLGY